ncbi:MAG: tyrosine-type recombinase/integrase [Deltaproteobacteria bacterium]|nr:tyrosine-type recombinase/integrase [Deltaproteobacteria bacterium]
MGRKYTGDRAVASWRRNKWDGDVTHRWIVVTTTWDSDRGRPRTREIPLPIATTQKQAEAAARRIAEELLAGRLTAPTTWTEAVAEFLAWRKDEGDAESGLTTYRDRFSAVGRLLGEPCPLRITREQGIDYRDARLKMDGSRTGSKISQRTVAAELDAVTAMQRHLVACGHAPSVTWADIKRPEGEHGREWLHPHQLDRWFRAVFKLEKRWPEWPALAIVLCHAPRPGEALRLRVADVDAMRGVVYVRPREGERVKSRRAVRAFTIADDTCLEVVRAWVNRRDAEAGGAGLLFPLGRRHESQACDAKPLRRRIRATSELAGVPYVSPYGLRHTAATLAGGDLRALASLLGHEDERTASRVYRHALPGQSDPATQAIGAHLRRALQGARLTVMGGKDDD